MSHIDNLIEILNIFKRNLKDGNVFDTAAEHDVLYFTTNKPIIFSKEDVLRLRKLGLSQENCDDDGDEDNEQYDEESSWYMFT